MATILAHCLKSSIASSTRQYAAVQASASAGGHKGGYKLWKKLSFFVAFPCIGLCMLNAYLGHIEDHDKPRPPFVKYEYLRIRTKRFPWGDGNKSFFHNPRVNALPDGYETEEEHHH